MTTLLADGQEVQIKDMPLAVVLHPGDMEVEAVGHFLIDPETTVKTANELEPDQWALIRTNENFLGYWKALWRDSPPPENLAKANLAVRHTVGLGLLLFMCVVEKRKMHLKLPESYLHPQQQALLMTAILYITGDPEKPRTQEAQP